MRKIPHKLLMLIVIINFIGIMLEGITIVDNSKTTVINNTAEKNTLETMKEKGVITVASPLNDCTYFYLDTKTNKIRGIDAGIVDSVIFKYSLLKDKNLLLRMLQDYTPQISAVVGIAVRKNDTELLNVLNEKINEMKVDGSLYAILVDDGLDKDNMISY